MSHFIKLLGPMSAALVALLSCVPCFGQPATVQSKRATSADSVLLGDVVVTGVRLATDVRHLPMTVNVMSRSELTMDHRASILPTATERVPGMLVTGRSLLGYGVSGGAAGGMSLRGITSGCGQLLVLVDGMPQYNGIYGHPIADSYLTQLADRVEVVRGPASMIYGSNAMGGVMNIVTRQRRQPGTQTTLSLSGGSYGTVEAQATTQSRYGRWATTLSANYGRTDNHRPRMGFEQFGGHLKVMCALSEHWNAGVDANVTHFRASHPGTVTEPLYDADQWITRGVATALLRNRYRKASGVVSAYYNFGRHKLNDGTADPVLSPTTRLFRSSDALAGVSAFESVTPFACTRLTVGVDYQHIYGHAYYTSKATGERLNTPNKQSGWSHRNEVALYADVRQEVVSWLTADAGIRWDHHSVSGTEWVPQVGLVARPCATAEIKAMASKGFRNPTMRELYLYPPSNEDLRAERLWNYELSWHQRLLNGRLQLGANLFYLKGDNMIQTINRRNVNTGKVENCGIEAEIFWQINDAWRLTTNHSWLHQEHPIVSAPDYKGYADVSWRRARWDVHVGLLAVVGLYTAVGEHEQKENFCLLNATVGFDAGRGVGLWVRGDNLLAQRYEYVKGYPMPRATVMAGASWTF